MLSHFFPSAIFCQILEWRCSWAPLWFFFLTLHASPIILHKSFEPPTLSEDSEPDLIDQRVLFERQVQEKFSSLLWDTKRYGHIQQNQPALLPVLPIAVPRRRCVQPDTSYLLLFNFLVSFNHQCKVFIRHIYLNSSITNFILIQLSRFLYNISLSSLRFRGPHGFYLPYFFCETINGASKLHSSRYTYNLFRILLSKKVGKLYGRQQTQASTVYLFSKNF